MARPQVLVPDCPAYFWPCNFWLILTCAHCCFLSSSWFLSEVSYICRDVLALTDRQEPRPLFGCAINLWLKKLTTVWCETTWLLVSRFWCSFFRIRAYHHGHLFSLSTCRHVGSWCYSCASFPTLNPIWVRLQEHLPWVSSSSISCRSVRWLILWWLW